MSDIIRERIEKLKALRQPSIDWLAEAGMAYVPDGALSQDELVRFHQITANEFSQKIADLEAQLAQGT